MKAKLPSSFKISFLPCGTPRKSAFSTFVSSNNPQAFPKIISKLPASSKAERNSFGCFFICTILILGRVSRR
jgi:hypothetical protein